MTDKEMPDVIKYLLGEGQLNGFEFGEKRNNMRPYWWRRELREWWDNHKAQQPKTLYTAELSEDDCKAIMDVEIPCGSVEYQPAKPKSVDVEALKIKCVEHLKNRLDSHAEADRIVIRQTIDHLASIGVLNTGLQSIEGNKKPLVAMYQEYDGDNFDIRTIIDIETLDFYKLLFLWTTFHQRMSQHMLKACGCSAKELPPTTGEGICDIDPDWQNVK